MAEFIQFRTIVPKQGNIDSYINKPVLDRISIDHPYESIALGVITDAKEVENGYELTISIFRKYQFEWFENGELSAMYMGLF